MPSAFLTLPLKRAVDMSAGKLPVDLPAAARIANRAGSMLSPVQNGETRRDTTYAVHDNSNSSERVKHPMPPLALLQLPLCICTVTVGALGCR